MSDTKSSTEAAIMARYDAARAEYLETAWGARPTEEETTEETIQAYHAIERAAWEKFTEAYEETRRDWKTLRADEAKGEAEAASAATPEEAPAPTPEPLPEPVAELSPSQKIARDHIVQQAIEARETAKGEAERLRGEARRALEERNEARDALKAVKRHRLVAVVIAALAIVAAILFALI